MDILADDIRTDLDVMVPMRDGVRLATDIFFPADNAAGTPILLYRTPYNKDESARLYGFARYFASHGYIVVQQDCRGCFKSGGEVNFLQPEAEDGYDTLAWIARQPWGDADVGMWGTSWSGWAQTAAASLAPQRLKTIVPMMSGADGYASSLRHNGALELRWIAWAFWHAAENTQANLGKTAETERVLIRPQRRFSDWLRSWPIRRGETQLTLTPAYERWVFDLMENEDRSPWWNTPSLNPARHRPEWRDPSALYIGSWYDSYTRATLENFTAHSASGRGRAFLLMGPWLHGTVTVEQPHAGGVSFPAEAAFTDYKAFLLSWFDRELKAAPQNDDAPIRLFVMGGGSGRRDADGRLDHGGRWRDEAEWPLARTRFTPFYLHSDGTLSTALPAPDSAALTYSYAPEDPVPTIGGNISSMLDIAHDPPAPDIFHRLPHKDRTEPLVAPGGFDQSVDGGTFRLSPATGPLADRADILTFCSEPLEADTEVTGPIVAELWVSTDAPDMDFTVKLIDVYPPGDDWPAGFALNISDSIVRLKYRDGAGVATPLEPRAVVPLRVELYPTSNVFAAGHRIRVDVASANFPRFDRCPHVGTNTVFMDHSRPSRIILPIIPT